jgi:adenylate cyclase
MAVEIERKFLLPEPPGWLGDFESSEVEQGYLAIADGSEVRVRRRDEQTLLTVKGGSGKVRAESEIELSREQFEKLWPLSEKQRVAKTRHLVPHDDGTIEVDVFSGELEGLVLAEIEFDSEESSEAFDPPDWLGREVTGERRYENESLAQRGMPDQKES